jgi:hypothetical protein
LNRKNSSKGSARAAHFQGGADAVDDERRREGVVRFSEIVRAALALRQHWTILKAFAVNILCNKRGSLFCGESGKSELCTVRSSDLAATDTENEFP